MFCRVGFFLRVFDTRGVEMIWKRSMIEPKQFFDSLQSQGVEFFTGVPDSLLKDFCAYVSDHTKEHHHIISANEGGAIGLAMGYHLATGKIPLVYMQNSGLGNAVNPLLSLADPEVYEIGRAAGRERV